MKSKISKRLHTIEKLVKVKEEELEEKNFEKYSYLSVYVAKFFSNSSVLLYGGQSIDELMPKKLKIYGPTKLPDIDVFAINPILISKGLVKFLRQNNINTASFGPALHEGTYTVYAEGNKVADITQISKKIFTILTKNSHKGPLGISTVNTDFIRLSLHMQLSQPQDARLWPKIFDRLIKFYKVYPPSLNISYNKIKDITIPDANNSNSEERFMRDIFNQRGYVSFSISDISKITNKKFKEFNIPEYQLLCDKDILEESLEIIKLSEPIKLTKSIIYESDGIIPRHIFIKKNNVKIACLYETEYCLSFIEYSNKRIGTINTILRMYLCMYLSAYSHFHYDDENLKTFIDQLTYLELKSIGSRKLFFNDVLECYGNQTGVITLRKEKAIKAKK